MHARIPKYLVVQGCPVNSFIAPYIAQIAHDAGATINSIYRGEDARAILHRHHKHTQRECYERQGQPGFGPANPPGRSTHELRGDGVAYGASAGSHLADWQQGFDVQDSDVARCQHAAHTRGWQLVRFYQSGSEYHHLNLAARPRPNSLRMRARIRYLRHALPTR